MEKNAPILIADGGIGGLVAALVLAQDGYPVTVLEEPGAFGEDVEGRALIGAVGMWSCIREAVVNDGKPLVSGHIAYRVVLKREDVPSHLWSDDVVLWGGEKTHLVHYPLRRGELFNRVAVFHSDPYDEGWNSFGDTAELEERFAAACAPVEDRDLENVGNV